jgi:glycosyltransferase involved in cell wall biosynthesis
MTRFAADSKVYFIEEFVIDERWSGYEVQRPSGTNVTVLVPHIYPGLSQAEINSHLRTMLTTFLDTNDVRDYTSWYYSPMALAFSDMLTPALVVYDCMDELSGFKFAPPELKDREAQLFGMADIVFTGGHTLFKAKKTQHHNIFPFPSSIDKAHFLSARSTVIDHEDQRDIPRPRLGFYGVLDERLNIELLQQLATARPDWHIVLIGPVVKIDRETLPTNGNIHYLGGKDYKELPSYLAGWDIAIMPFAMNESTTFISPTKTPEYLAGGKPVISTPISDVVNDYGSEGLVAIAETAEEFVEEGEIILANENYEQWLARVDEKLSDMSWDNTWQDMKLLMEETMNNKKVYTETSMKYV